VSEIGRFQSIYFPNEWGHRKNFVASKMTYRFQSIYFPNEWGLAGAGKRVNKRGTGFQSIYFPNEWGLV